MMLAGRQHPVQIVAADDVADHQHAGEEAEPAGRCDDQGHPRAVARLRVLMPVADQKEGEEARQFPEEDELDQVARQHDAEHRAHEREQEREEARHRIGRRHVVAGVKHHQEADAGDQHGEDPGEAVHPQAELEAEIRHPLHLVSDYAAPSHLRVARQYQYETDKSDGGS